MERTKRDATHLRAALPAFASASDAELLEALRRAEEAERKERRESARERSASSKRTAKATDPEAVLEAFLLVAGGMPLREACEVLGERVTGKKLSPAGLWRIVTDPAYTEVARTPAGELVKGWHEALVPMSLFRRTQEQLKKRKKRPLRVG